MLVLCPSPQSPVSGVSAVWADAVSSLVLALHSLLQFPAYGVSVVCVSAVFSTYSVSVLLRTAADSMLHLQCLLFYRAIA